MEEERVHNNFTDQLSHFEALEKYLEKKTAAAVKDKVPEPYESEKTEQICTALSKAQGEFPEINTNRANNFSFNQYSDLDIIMRALRKTLSDNGLSITQQTKLIDDKVILVTRLRHKSSQFIETRSRIIPSRNDIQTYASAAKAMKRHDIMGLLNITIVDDLDDDDAERDMEYIRTEQEEGTSLNAQYREKKESAETINADQASEINYVLRDHPDIGERLLVALNIQALSDMPKSMYYDVKRKAQLNVNQREGKSKL